MKPYKRLFKESNDFDAHTGIMSCGFAINVGDEYEITDNFKERYGHTPNDNEWKIINKDINQLEHNAMQWLKKTFKSASDEGHDGSGDLIGSIDMNTKDNKQMKLLVKHYAENPKDSGLWFESSLTYKNVKYDQAYDVKITFFDIPEEVVEMLDL